MPKENKYDLKERIRTFVLVVIQLAKDLPDNPVNRIFVNQIVRSVSSIGACYEEADGTPSRKDFIYKMGLTKKEAKETNYWLTLIKATNNASFYNRIDSLYAEGEQLIRIFASIIIKSSK